jgi:serine/threonine-protein kinase
VNCYRCSTPVPDNSRFCLSCGADLSGDSAERTLPVEADPELLAKLQTEVGGDYILDKELGRGGMAIVFLARDAHLGRQVAIKLLPPELSFSGGRGLVQRFKREARTAATLDHPHIIPVYRVSTSGKLFWYVMKYLAGESLDGILRREGQMDLERAAQIVAQVAEALGYAHQHGVVHRDVKPANVMIDDRGWVTVTDFGIAKAVDTGSLTASGSMIGTPYYMSPEQCSGKKVTPASDQYSLGVMTFQMLAGLLPFTGDSVVDIVRKHVMDPVPPLGVLRPNLPEAVVTVVERALSKDPLRRYPTVLDFARALEGAARGFDVTLAPPPPSIPFAASLPPVPIPAEARGPARKLAAGGGVVAALALAALVLWPRPSRRPAPVVAPAESVAAAETSAAGIRGPAPRPRTDGAAARLPEDAARPLPAAPQAAAPAPRPAVGWITVGSNPLSAISINGRAVPGNPVTRYEVPAGAVTILFQAQDSLGPFSHRISVNVAAGETLNLRRVPLSRGP